MTTVQVHAPAKVNLGLEVIGRRADGYHEIRSILAKTTLADTVAVTLADSPTSVVFYGTGECIDPTDNLIVRAIDAYNATAGTRLAANVTVDKRIPVAAGLGGASSDAAATLIALQNVSGNALDEAGLLAVAAKLGSDVPFFLGPPVALVEGRGTDLTPLPAVSGFLLIVMPDIVIDRKTATLYAALCPGDLTDGSTVASIAAAIRDGEALPASFPNAFDRVFRRLDERMTDLVSRLQSAGLGPGSLSGAGPARFLAYTSAGERDDAFQALQEALTPAERLIPCELVGDDR